MVYRSGRSKHHQCISLLQKPTGASPPQKQNSVALSGHTGVVGEEGYPCVCKAVKRGAEEEPLVSLLNPLCYFPVKQHLSKMCVLRIYTERWLLVKELLQAG
ncbi:hypothetical protein CHARACLAT_028807 [Characodon lateralis]|uniref:Uncharacterized protein n=1 Tax=Characodon lateralis TaxID=208331 RepID=A0ABU7D1J7_9TELE|nr:hypothetical protein [Characodon lateralis]